MNWSCLKCGHDNSPSDRQCAECGAKRLFETSTVSAENSERSERFRVPRRGELTLLLHQGVEAVRAGHIELDEFRERMEMAAENVPQVFAVIIEDVLDASEEVSEYGDGVATSLSDSQALFESGLAEFLLYCKDREDFHLRFGWLLIEKGEEEYVRIMETLNRDASEKAFAGADNVVGRLYQALQLGVLTEDEYRGDLLRFEATSHETLEEVGALISEGVELAAEQNDQAMTKAASKFEEAASVMGSLVLNLYAVEENPKAG